MCFVEKSSLLNLNELQITLLTFIFIQKKNYFVNVKTKFFLSLARLLARGGKSIMVSAAEM